jgi:hypothetical protein
LIAAGVGAAALIAALWLTPVAVRRVDVTGTRRLARAEVARWTGVTPGARLTFAGARRIEAAMERLPALTKVTVMRGITGTLHVRVTERPPAAWLPRYGCAVAADGTLLPHLNRREPEWVGLDGFTAVRGALTDSALFAEALMLAKLVAVVGVGDAGVIRRVPGECWEWLTAGKRVRLSSPPAPQEAERLRRFREACPAAWALAGRMDVRFRERVVVKP